MMNMKDIFSQLRNTLSFLKYVLRVEDSNHFVTEIAKNLQVFKTVESIIFYEEFIRKIAPANEIVLTFIEEIKTSYVSLIFLLVDSQRPALNTKGEPSVKCIFDEKGSTQYAIILKFMKEKFDFFSLCLIFKDFLKIRKRDEIDLEPERYLPMSHIVRFIVNNKYEDEFFKIQKTYINILNEEDSANVINFNVVFYTSNISKFERICESIISHLEFVNFIIVYNYDTTRLLIESECFSIFLWKAYFYSVEIEENFRLFTAKQAIIDEDETTKINLLLERQFQLQKLILCLINNLFEVLEIQGFYTRQINDKFPKSKLKNLDRVVQKTVIPFFELLLRKCQTEQTHKSVFGRHLKLIIRNCTYMRDFMKFILFVIPNLKNDCPQIEHIMKYYKDKSEKVKPKKHSVNEKKRKLSEKLNEIEELAQVNPINKHEEVQQLQSLTNLIEKAKHKDLIKKTSKNPIKNDIFEGLYDDEYDDTFDTPIYAPRDDGNNSENECLENGESEQSKFSENPSVRQDEKNNDKTQSNNNQGNPPPFNNAERKDRFKKNKREYMNKTKNKYYGEPRENYIKKKGD